MAKDSNSKSTRRALVTSALALVACVAVLVGITYAWFTDVAKTSTNQITSGKLDVALQMKVDGEWVSAEGQTLQWTSADGNSDFVWEPGCTYTLPELRVVNAGDRALKYKLEITGVDGSEDLLKAIDFTYGDGVQISTEVSLAPGEFTDGIVIEGHMKETAGNEYQGMTLNGIQITVVATQDAVESDSYGSDYDAAAGFAIADNDSLAEAIRNAKSGDIIQVAAGEYMLPIDSLPEGVTLTGDGAATVLSVTANGSTGYKVVNDNVTISNVALKSDGTLKNWEYAGILDAASNGLTLDNVTFTTTGSVSSIAMGNTTADTVMTIKNSTFTNGFKPIDFVDGANGTVNIDNCEITGTYTFNVNSASSQDLVINVTNSKLHGWTSYGNIKSVSFVGTEFSQGGSAYDFLRAYADTTFENCTFDEAFALGCGATGKTITIDNCTKNGVKITADNVESVLLSMQGSDGTNLAGCTIIVDGVTVTLA